MPIPAGFAPAFAWGIAASALTGWFAVGAPTKLVRTHTFTPFVIGYRLVVGTAVLAVYFLR